MARRLATLDQIPVTELSGVGGKKAEGLDSLGVRTVLDLLTFYPRRYLDRTIPDQLLVDGKGESFGNRGSWSPDGTSLIGTTEGNLWIFDRETAAYEPLMSGSAPTWLSTSRRIIFATEGRLAMLDLPSRYTRAIMLVPDVQLDAPFLSPDNRWLYFNRNAAEANLWTLTFN